MNADKTNPYADEHGHPKSGMMHEFFAWQSEKETKRRKKLPPEEQKELKAADKHLADKMRS